MASPKLIVVLGASYGGVSMTHYLLKHVVPSLAQPSDYQVVLVSPSDEIIGRPAMPRAMISDAAFDQKLLFVKVTSVLEQYPARSARFLHGTATALDHVNKVVTIQSPGDAPEPELLNYHALIIATGATTYSPLLGLTTDSHALRASWKALRNALPDAKTIVIAGGGPAGIETAGELGEHLNGKPGWFQKKPANPKAAITVVTGADQILPHLTSALALKAESQLAKVGVAVRKNTKVTAAESVPLANGAAVSKTVVTLSDGTTLDADIYIPAMGFRYNTGFVDADLLDADSRVSVNGSTLRVDVAGENALLYAVGDVSSAHRAAIPLLYETIPVLCNNIKRDLLRAEGKPEAELPADKTYVENKKMLQVVPIGSTTGVGAIMGFSVPAFLVKMMKGRDYFMSATPQLWSGQQWAKP